MKPCAEQSATLLLLAVVLLSLCRTPCLCRQPVFRAEIVQTGGNNLNEASLSSLGSKTMSSAPPGL